MFRCNKKLKGREGRKRYKGKEKEKLKKESFGSFDLKTFAGKI